MEEEVASVLDWGAQGKPSEKEETRGRPKAVSIPRKNELKAEVRVLEKKRAIPTESQFDAMVLESAKKTFTDKHGRPPPPEFNLSERTMKEIKWNPEYFNETEPIFSLVKAQTTTDSRDIQERCPYNAITTGWVLHTVAAHVKDEAMSNLDSTMISLKGLKPSTERIMTTETKKEYHATNRNVKIAPHAIKNDDDIPLSPYSVKLLTGIIASGWCFPFVLVIEADVPSDYFEPFELKGFGVDKHDVGYAVVVNDVHGRVMNKVYKWYFETVILPYIKSLPGRSQSDPPIFLVTMDGDTPQLTGLDDTLRQTFVSHNVVIVKLPAATSAILQASDVSVCYRTLKRLVKRLQYYGVVNEATRTSLSNIDDDLLRRSDSPWKSTFVKRLWHAVLAIGPNLAEAFVPPAIISTYQRMGWLPFDLECILSRTNDITEETIQLCLEAWPRLLEIVRKDSYGVTDEMIVAARFPPLDEDGKIVQRTVEEQRDLAKAHDSLAFNRLRAIIMTAPSWKKFRDLVRENKLVEKAKHASLMEIRAENKRRLKLEKEELKKETVKRNKLGRLMDTIDRHIEKDREKAESKERRARERKNLKSNNSKPATKRDREPGTSPVGEKGPKVAKSETKVKTVSRKQEIESETEKPSKPKSKQQQVEKREEQESEEGSRLSDERSRKRVLKSDED